MRLLCLVLLVALVSVLVGCGIDVAPIDSHAGLTDADFDAWRSGDSRASGGEAQGAHAPRSGADASVAREVQGPLINGIVDRVIEHVDSVDAKVHFRQQNRVWQATVESIAKSAEPGGLAPRTPARPPSPAAVTKIPPPPPAPPAEPLALAQSEAATVETLDIPQGWTGAAVYHAATCVHCPALLAGLRGRATKVSGNYLLVDGCWFLLVDWDQRPDVDRPKIKGLPAVLYFVNGHEREADRVIGFGNRPGELEMIIARHPQQTKRTNVGQAASLPFPSDASAAWQAGSLPYGYEAAAPCPCGPACACVPGSQCGCLGGAMASAPIWYETPTPGVSGSFNTVPAQHSAGISLFGVPVIGGSIGTCPTYGP
jgi:hypothetical protein